MIDVGVRNKTSATARIQTHMESKRCLFVDRAGYSYCLEGLLTPVWDVVKQQWRLAEGDYIVFVGASSRDLRLSRSFMIKGAS